MIATGSPVFRAPRKGWEITPIGERGPVAGSGVLDLRVGWCGGRVLGSPAQRLQRVLDREQSGDPVASEAFLRSSLVPVVLVDGKPNATGWGRIRVPLSAGRHLVEVQTQHSRTWRAVDVEAGGTTKIDYVGMLGESHREYGGDELPYRLRDLTGHAIGPRGRLNYFQYLPANAKERLSFALFLASILIAGMSMAILAYFGAPVGVYMSVSTAIWVSALAFWGIRIAWTYFRFNRSEPEAPLDSRAFTRPGRTAPVVLDADGDLPALEPGAAGVLLDARFLKADLASDELALQLPEGQRHINGPQRKALDAVGEIVPIRHRYAAPPPEVLLDGVPLGAFWTRMWWEVPPGTHRLEVRTPAPPLPVEGEAHPPHTAVATVNVAAGEAARIDLAVTVTAVPDPLRPVLHLWHCRIDRFGPAPDREAPAAPKADVRGGLRRTVTGRYWETKDDIPRER
ncbi:MULTISPECIES: hypothetical protein [Glycomyces]|uniref:Uncharacterized protein n=2 Tax=Glycomyces TaxID=58113 RepID=A0A9X3PET7_9ACTN|nr:hypothetical protein [Glycomyces lechevalierae]MDA1384249.1 hypothetical protein [Glycomyces lechevalierae]MDR7339321.1 hypothetical protein [Glycomyces lechevalierae]